MKNLFKQLVIITFTVLIGFTLVSCPEPEPPESTPGLAFTLINNGTAYSVSKGTSNAAVVIIPLVHNGLPVVEIEDSGFSSYANMTSIIIPDGVTKIGNYAFFNCGNLKSVVIPAGTTNIGNFAFSNCNNLDTIFYGGADSAAWEAISIGSNNIPLAGATCYYYSEAKPETDNTHWRFISGVSVVWGTFTSSSGIEMMYIPAGTFRMGSPSTETGRWNDENYRSSNNGIVTLTQGFYMSKYPVTQEQYQTVMGVNPSYFHGGSGREPTAGEVQSQRPVETVTWFDAIEFCNKLSELEGLTPVYTITGRTPATGYPISSATVTANWNNNGYRLPTEAQWEYACRAGTETRWYFGETQSELVDYAWYSANSNTRTHQVGLKLPNAWGLYDMHGNVWEWCWDWYASSYNNAGGSTDPRGAVSGDNRVIRGGWWSNSVGYTRSASRDNYDPSYGYVIIGFRLLRP